jgi:hypothetical protein
MSAITGLPAETQRRIFMVKIKATNIVDKFIFCIYSCWSTNVNY